MHYGHSDPFNFTPRQAIAFADLGRRRESEELANRFVSMQHAVHADKKGADKFMEKVLDGTV